MPILTQTYEGAPGGMNLFLPAQQLDDTEVRYAQDILFDIPGEIRMRGPQLPINGFASVSKPASGIVQTLDPNGASRFAVLYGDNTVGNFAAYSADLSNKTDLPWNGVLPTTPASGLPYRNVDSKSALNGGSLVGTSSAYDSNSPIQTLAFWKGGNKADYATGTISTLSRGGTAVVGSGTSWLTNVVAGMFLFGSTDDGYTNTFIGVVQSVNSNTSITLVDPSPYPMTAKAYNLTSLRGFQVKVGAGRITAATTATAVNGGATKFSDQKLSTGSWNIYRASDMAWLGKVSSVTSNIQLTLTANAAVSCNNEHYVALRADGDWSINSMAVANQKMGFLNATYADRQWYANNGQKFQYTSRLWFSEPADPELVDLSPNDGNFIDIGSSTGANTPIKAIMPAYNALVILKDNEAYGVFGTSTDSFNPKKISDDGVINGMSVQPYAGGVIWAGRQGVYFYDGNQATNMTAEKLGQSYKAWIKSFDPTVYRLWSLVIKNHYFLFFESFVSDTAVIKGTTSSTPTQMTLAINMDTGAVTTLTNINIRGSVVLPASTGQTTWYVANGTLAGTPGTLGRAAKGPNQDAGYSGYKSASGFTMPAGSAATANSVSAWIDIFTNPVTARAMVYSDSAGVPGSLLAQSADQVIQPGSSQNITFPLLGAYALQPSTKYWIAVGFDAGGGTVDVWSETAGTGTHIYINNPAATASYGAGSSSNSDNDLSIAYTTIPTQTGYICDAATLFENTGRDTLTADSGVPGPSAYVESKKYAEGDSMRKKLFKQIALDYLAQGGSLQIDTIVGLNNVGIRSLTELPPTVLTWDALAAGSATWNAVSATYPTWSSLINSLFKPKRIKFLKRSQHFAFRIYAKDNTLTKFIIGPFQLGYKEQRPGRI